MQLITTLYYKIQCQRAFKTLQHNISQHYIIKSNIEGHLRPYNIIQRLDITLLNLNSKEI